MAHISRRPDGYSILNVHTAVSEQYQMKKKKPQQQHITVATRFYKAFHSVLLMGYSANTNNPNATLCSKPRHSELLFHTGLIVSLTDTESRLIEGQRQQQITIGCRFLLLHEEQM